MSLNDASAAERPSLAPALVQRARGPVIVWVFVTILALAAANATPEHVLQVLYGHLIATAVLALWTLVRTIGAAFPSGETSFGRAFEPSTIPDELAVMRRTVMFARTALDAHTAGPVFEKTADAHLVARRARARRGARWVRAHLGPSVWDAIQPREKLPDAHTPGLDIAQLTAIVAELEGVATS